MYICVLVISKEKIIDECKKILLQKIEELKSALELVNEAANNETKSTAGDKHETAKAMMQLEQEKLSMQLSLKQTELNNFIKLNSITNKQYVVNGSLVKTNVALFFIGTSLGKIEVETQTIFCISHSSPLAKLFFEKKASDSVFFNDNKYTILEIF